MTILLGASALLVGLTRQAAAQGAMSGIVREDSSGRPLPGVEVLLDRTAHRALTNTLGRYFLGGVPAGRYSTIFRVVGHLPVRMDVTIVAGDTIRANTTLVRSNVVLEPIEVIGETPRPRGDGLEAFEERRRMGFGKFIDSTEMRRSEHIRLDDLLKRHGVAIVEVSGSMVPLNPRYRGLMGGYNCALSIYLDGVRIGEGGRSEVSGLNFELLDVRRLIKTHQLAAAEVYFGAGSVPAQFGGASGGCGAVVLWSRRAP
ncbi:MAG: carboxypeptidase regulatory-like domain-containing protein [Gemmatimonadales bacterium]